MMYRRIAISTLAVAALGLAACNSPATPAPGDAVTPEVQETAAAPAETPADPAATEPAATDDTPVAEPTDDGGQDQPAPSGDVDLDQVAQAIALAESETGGTAYEIDDEDNDTAWEIDVLLPDGTAKEVKVNREGTEVLKVEDESTEHTQLPSTTLMDAIRAALDHTPGVLDDAELDDEDGQIVWKVEVDKTDSGDDVDLYLDVETLEVIKTD